jgi:hypothetical protein
MMLGTAMPATADAGLNPDNKGYYIVKKSGGKVRIGFMTQNWDWWWRTVCKRGNKAPGSMNGRGFLDK